jgi:hypothetical protein
MGANRTRTDGGREVIEFRVHGILFKLGVEEAYRLHVQLGNAVLEADPKKRILILEEGNGDAGAGRRVIGR